MARAGAFRAWILFLRDTTAALRRSSSSCAAESDGFLRVVNQIKHASMVKQFVDLVAAVAAEAFTKSCMNDSKRTGCK